MFVEPSWSVTVISISYPSSLSSGLMKFILMLSKWSLETERECNSLIGLDVVLLRSMPPGVNMDMGKGYDDDNRLRRSSLSQRLM